MIEVTAPMVGKLLEIKVNVGDQVREDDVVAVLEAMKMHVEVFSPGSGTVAEVLGTPGEVVKAGQVLLKLK